MPARLISIFCGIAGPIMIAGVTLPKVVLPMCSSSGLKGLSRTNVRGNNRQIGLTVICVKRIYIIVTYPPGRIVAILPTG
jgi:hypothetical protein